MAAALDRLGVEFRGISQTARVHLRRLSRPGPAGHARAAAGSTRCSRGTARRPGPGPRPARRGCQSGTRPRSWRPGIGRGSEDDGSTSAGYFPYKPYCSACERDLTTVTGYDDADHRAVLHLRVRARRDRPADRVSTRQAGLEGRLADALGLRGRGVRAVRRGPPVARAPRSWSAASWSARSSAASSRSARCTRSSASAAWRRCPARAAACRPPADALEIMEEPLLRWLYARRRPQQSFTVAFDQEIQRLYDEWDAVERKVAGGAASDPDAASYDRAVRTAARGTAAHAAPAAVPHAGLGRRHHHRRPASRPCASSATWTRERPLASLDEVRPRLDRAAELGRDPATGGPAHPAARRARHAALAALTDAERGALKLLLDGLDAHWSLDGLSQLVYAVPKLQAGLRAGRQADARAEGRPSARSSRCVYRLLIGRRHRAAAADAAARGRPRRGSARCSPRRQQPGHDEPAGPAGITMRRLGCPAECM